MPHIINPVSIFLPMLAIVALTFVAFVHMAMARTAAAKAGQDPAFYRAHLGPPEPEATTAAVRHFNILFELPLLFYAGCITAFVLGAVGTWTLVFAWLFAIARWVQSLIHMSYNLPAHRGLAFVVGMAAVIALWVNLTLAIVARL